MAYTAAQLAQYYTAVNEGQAPDAGTQLQLNAVAAQDAGSQITDAQALKAATNSAQTYATTDVALATYQFYTGASPSQAGLSYLVNTPGGGFNTSYFNGTGPGASATNPGVGGFNLENRYYNESIALATTSATGANFAATYGGLTPNQTIAAAYETIVGSAIVGAAQAQAAIASIQSSMSYFIAKANERAGGVDAGGLPGQNIALKAVIVGYILEEAVKADVGSYAHAIDNFNTAVAIGTPIYNTNLIATYGAGSPSDSTGSQGVTITYALTDGTAINATQANTAYRSTSGDDTVNATGATFQNGATIDLGGGNDTVTSGTLSASNGLTTSILLGAGSDTFGTTLQPVAYVNGATTGNVLIDGGAGTDSLTLLLSSNISPSGVQPTTITNVETVNFGAAGTSRSVDASAITGATTLNHITDTQNLFISNIANGTTVGNSSSHYTSFTFNAGSTSATLNLYGSVATAETDIYNVAGTVTLTHTGNVTAQELYLQQSTGLVDAGSGEVNLGLVYLEGTGNHTVDLSSAARAALNYVAEANAANTETVKLTAGSDVIGLDFDVNNNLTIYTGGGNDTINVSSNFLASGGTISQGDINLVSGAISTFTKVADFAKGSDHINVALGSGAFVNTSGNSGYIGAASLTAAANVAAAALGGTNPDATVFEYQGSTYVFQDNDHSKTVSTNDLLIQLVGVTGVTTGTGASTVGSVDIHFG